MTSAVPERRATQGAIRRRFAGLAAGVAGAAAWLAAPIIIRRLLRCNPGERVDLSPEDRRVLAGYFGEELLGRVRVIATPVVRTTGAAPGFFAWGAARLLPVRSTVGRAAGLTLGRTVVIGRDELASVAGAVRFRSLLFHELVHVVQYEHLGQRGFFREYVRGWALAGLRYREIPLERDAYELQGRFDAGAHTDGEAEGKGKGGGREFDAGAAAIWLMGKSKQESGGPPNR